MVWGALGLQGSGSVIFRGVWGFGRLWGVCSFGFRVVGV